LWLLKVATTMRAHRLDDLGLLVWRGLAELLDEIALAIRDGRQMPGTLVRLCVEIGDPAVSSISRITRISPWGSSGQATSAYCSSPVADCPNSAKPGRASRPSGPRVASARGLDVAELAGTTATRVVGLPSTVLTCGQTMDRSSPVERLLGQKLVFYEPSAGCGP